MDGNTNGDGSDIASGGGIFNEESNLILDNSTVTQNTVDGTADSGNGGGIGLYQGLVQIINGSEVSDNTASLNGGGLYASDTDNSDTKLESFVIEDSKIDNNEATNGNGGGIFNYYYLTILNSTVSNNRAPDTDGSGEDQQGGGIYDYSYGATVIQNTTISGNTVGGDGGGVYSDSYGAS
ncbi:MAG: hypothetical protein EBU84_22180, partial [Actinobacteria bacterium]|nr:hypothetical protein [Actinomycetota bacterium]